MVCVDVRWRWAGDCVVSDVRRQVRGRNWPSVLLRARLLVDYVRSYRQHLSQPASDTAEAKLRRDTTETELELAELQVPFEKPAPPNLTLLNLT